MSIDRIELRKKYYDGNMVREAVMSVTDDYNTIMKLLKAFSDQPPLTDVIEVVRCKDCRYYYRHEFFGKPYFTCDIANQYMTGDIIGVGFEPPEDWYCADGERRDG